MPKVIPIPLPRRAFVTEKLSLEINEAGELVIRIPVRTFIELLPIEIPGTEGELPRVQLTMRQRELLRLILMEDQLQNKELADVMHITVRTVKFHIQQLYRIFGVATKTELRNKIAKSVVPSL